MKKEKIKTITRLEIIKILEDEIKELKNISKNKNILSYDIFISNESFQKSIFYDKKK